MSDLMTGSIPAKPRHVMGGLDPPIQYIKLRTGNHGWPARRPAMTCVERAPHV